MMLVETSFSGLTQFHINSMHGTPELHFEIRMAREETEKRLQAWGPN